MEGRRAIIPVNVVDDDTVLASLEAAVPSGPKRSREEDSGPVYAVAVGTTRSIFFTWDECDAYVHGCSGAVHEKFDTVKDAEAWFDSARPNVRDEHATDVYIDGSCQKGRAGVGVWFGNGDARNVSERLEGAQQTNQRAELTALIRALEMAPNVPLHVRSDSEYCVLGVNFRLNWWATTGWQERANIDLWRRIHALLSRRAHSVVLEHVRAHSGNPGNDAADRLAKAGIAK